MPRDHRRLAILIGIAITVIVAVSIVLLFRAPPPWIPLQACRVTRIQAFDSNGVVELDTALPDMAVKPETLDRVSALLHKAEYSYSRVRSVTSTLPIPTESLSLVLDVTNDGQKYMLKIDCGSACRMHKEGDGFSTFFLTPRHKRLYDQIGLAVGAKSVEKLNK